ncbi:MAG: twin-arginine translocation signal domain-containing protein [Candidatus Eremiobacterota bacterium]
MNNDKKSNISTNIEKILIKASLDEKFKETLLNKRNSILDMEEFSLNNIDKMLLSTISSERLEDMIEKFMKHYMSRRNFLKGAAASVALISGSLIASSCCPVPVTGARPEPPLVSETVLPDGSTIDYSYSGLKIVIPPGAVDKSITIKISVIIPPGPAPQEIIFLGEVYNISAESFQKDISIMFPATNKGGDIKAFSWKNSKWKEISLQFERKPPDLYIPVIKTKNDGIYTLGYKIDVPTATPGTSLGARVQ